MSITGDRVLLKTSLNPTTGYGIDGMQLSEALVEAGAEVHLEPKYVQVPLTPLVADLLTQPRPKHFEVAINHEYPGEMGFPPRLQQHANKLVAWTMFEFDSFGPAHEFVLPNSERPSLDERLSVFDLVLVYDDVSYKALAEYMPNDLDRLQILQGGYDSESWLPKGDEESYRDWDGTFRFVMNGTMNLRKNPFAVIDAFALLKNEYGKDFDAELHLKTTSMALHPGIMEWIPDIHIHYDAWTNEEIKELYLRSHCLLAPSWGEGKNLPALEAQTTGMAAIVSKVGGHLQWADPEWTYLVEGPRVEHSEGQGSMRVSTETVAEAMWHVYNNRTEARLKGELASRILPLQSDWDAVVYRLKGVVDAVEPRSRVNSAVAPII